MNVDIVRELIDRLLEAAHREGTLTESVALEVERSFRRDFSGAECYVKERTGDEIEKKRSQAVSDYLSGKPVERIVSDNGISRATLYRYLKR